MEQNIPNNNSNAIESQIRECYGRVCHSHKTHEKMADLCLSKLKKIKIAEIILSALTTTSLLYIIWGDNRALTIFAAICSTILFCISLYSKEYNLGEIAQKHTNAAHKLWFVRESFLSLLVDIKNNIPFDVIREKRDQLNQSLSTIYMGSPRTNSKAYKLSRDALKNQEELTFSDSEIDMLLPLQLRRKNNSSMNDAESVDYSTN